MIKDELVVNMKWVEMILHFLIGSKLQFRTEDKTQTHDFWFLIAVFNFNKYLHPENLKHIIFARLLCMLKHLPNIA